MGTRKNSVMQMTDKNYELRCFCIYHGTENILFESEWEDCTHPQRQWSRCPFTYYTDCHLAVPNTRWIEKDKQMCKLASDFWKEFRKREPFEHICDISLEDLHRRHRNVLALIEKYDDPVAIGNLLIGKYYGEAWSSRSCSGHMADLVGTGDYMDFYCGSSVYFAMMNLRPRDDPLLADFERADRKDRDGAGLLSL